VQNSSADWVAKAASTRIAFVTRAIVRVAAENVG
jgi:hypothetical protein